MFDCHAVKELWNWLPDLRKAHDITVILVLANVILSSIHEESGLIANTLCTIEFSHNIQSWQYWHLIQMYWTTFKE